MQKLKSLFKKSIPLLVFSAISLLVGLLAAALTKNNMQIYEEIITPPLAPPAWLFPVAWTVLYVLMGIGAGMMYKRKDDFEPEVTEALRLFFVQLVFNFLWSIIFFNVRAFWLAVVVLVALLVLIVLMIVRFYKVEPISAYLQIPYVLWVSFALYLNIAIAILN